MRKETKMKVTLRTKSLSNGVQSIYLDVYDKGKRKYEYLKLYLVPEVNANAKRENASAMKKANEIKAQYILGKYRPEVRHGECPTLMDWFDTYYIYMKEERNVSKAVYDHLHLLRPILNGFLTKIRKQNMTVAEFGRNEVLGFLMYMRNWKAEKKGKLSQGTMVAYQQRFVAVFNAAITEGHIKVNPFDLIKKNERIAKVRSTKNSLTMDEVERIADVVPVKKEDAEVQRAFLFACFTGIRISDIRELKWTDIKEMGEYKAIVKIQIKTDELVTVPLCKKAMEYLPDQREDEYVFHLPLKTGLRLGLKRIIDAAGIDSPTTFHTSRHTFATLTFASGSDLATVSRLLGHSSVATTEIYADVLMESKVKAMKGISDLFK